ncbi:MAG: helix-turn-helix domain-containing protein [Thermogemmatispora sp.]|uniref:MmyB family transcriptional regulator n=1 Tax=Thermogemmatispora sp. TaxID=1968838 RepID=UPI0026249D1F|nr:helix-turn-helix domain-containing protein [Thermogemmatispora sp.]MBX5458055.1 helix-turn-helix domain-containing protein [Thermogemmatispora sp.]
MSRSTEALERSEFARLLTELRQQHGLSQGQLAQASRLSRTYIYHLEVGMRTNPSPHVVRNIARALELQGAECQRFYDAYTRLTGQHVEPDRLSSALLELGELASLLVQSTSYPAHSLDRLWFLHSWNAASLRLFEIDPLLAEQHPKLHLLEFVFDPQMRRRFHGWEELAHRLVSDFLYNTHTMTHLPEYKALWRRLRELPEFKRIASAAYPSGKPAPSFVFQVQHSELGRLTLRTATTVFTGMSSYSMVSYVPGDQQTLKIYREQGW